MVVERDVQQCGISRVQITIHTFPNPLPPLIPHPLIPPPRNKFPLLHVACITMMEYTVCSGFYFM